jgi:carbonic anhydrase
MRYTAQRHRYRTIHASDIPERQGRGLARHEDNPDRKGPMISSARALARLREGNRRFAAGTPRQTLTGDARRAELLDGQEPFAIILGCSDSRAPAELIFDQGLGDLFVIRVAGNIVAPSQVGSVEFAATRFNTRLVVVLGHSRCGAILATLDELRRPSEDQSPNLRSIVDRVRPALESLLTLDVDPDTQSFVQQAVRANVLASVDHLRHGSAILEELIAHHQLAVVGAEYSLETGEVDFFETS